ncbi:FAD-dependent oxidoreductase (plasmid) [Salipiger sp. H15]|uniref:FAD-dependent oxidoreductase n=1 Tax=Alloyangia sp. H15 TaxID=3029062 RepID=A0AAU8APY4_9RHOB
MSGDIFYWRGQPLPFAPGESVAHALGRAGIAEFGPGPTGTARAVFCGIGQCQMCLVEVAGRSAEACLTPAPRVCASRRNTAARRRSAMTEREILVVGAGLAGVGAAVELARAGQRVLVIDRAPRAGGAVHRQPLPGRAAISSHAARWDRLIAEAEALPIDWAFETRFAGLDHGGTALLGGGVNRLMRPAAVVLALGAREAVRPGPAGRCPA